jgi:hypothetical protein
MKGVYGITEQLTIIEFTSTRLEFD